MESQGQLSQQHRSQTASLQNSNMPNGVAAYVCILHMVSTTTEEAPVAEGLPEEANGVGDSRKKNDRDGSTLPTSNG